MSCGRVDRRMREWRCCNGAILNFTNIANDAQVPRSTVKDYIFKAGERDFRLKTIEGQCFS